jgi:hypothetical protein
MRSLAGRGCPVAGLTRRIGSGGRRGCAFALAGKSKHGRRVGGGGSGRVRRRDRGRGIGVGVRRAFQAQASLALKLIHVYAWACTDGERNSNLSKAPLIL